MKMIKAFASCSIFTGAVMAVGHLDYSTQTATEPNWILLSLFVGIALAGLALFTSCEIVEEEREAKENGH